MNTKNQITIDQFSINCTGDACVGDKITFERAIFEGSFRKAKFAGYERIFCHLIKDSYGAAKQQHTFTCICLLSGRKFTIKGRNLYRNGCSRMPWTNENDRIPVLADKHERGSDARFMAFIRKNQL